MLELLGSAPLTLGLCAATGLASVGATLLALGVRRRKIMARVRETLDAMPAGLAYYDRQDRIRFWNRRYAEQGGAASVLLRQGAGMRELMEAGIDAGYYPEAEGRREAWLRERLSHRREPRGAFEQQQQDRWLRLDERRTGDGGIISVSMDVTDLKRAAEDLAAARDQAVAADRAKSEFLANMSHELRTPLNGVIGVAHALTATPLSAEQRNLLRIVETSAIGLNRLLSDLLDLAQVESGRLSLRPERFDLAAAVADVTGLWAPHAQAKGLVLSAHVTEPASTTVLGDPLRLKQVLGNLLSNAVKFTDAGAVTLKVARRQGPDGADLFRFTVTDTGPGFDEVEGERLFGRFHQLDGSATRRFGGSGLGLAISRDLARLMGGDLTAHARPGEGASFVLEIPLDPVAPGAVLDTPAPLPPEIDAELSDAPRPRVLLVEDHPVNRQVVELILSAADVDLTACENGEEGVAAFRRQRFDLVLMDMQMPVMDGLTATRAIRDYEAEDGRAATPIVMLTANALPVHVQQAHDAGCDDHMSKPVSAPALLGLVAGLEDRSELIAA